MRACSPSPRERREGDACKVSKAKRAHYGFANGLLLTGDRRYVDTWWGTLERVNASSREIDGRTQYPRMYGAEGWYLFEPEKFAPARLVPAPAPRSQAETSARASSSRGKVCW